MNHKHIALFRLSAFLLAISIGLKAFGTHVLQSQLFDTATRYLLFGSTWLLILTKPQDITIPLSAIRMILTGLLLFSGSLLIYLVFPIKYIMLLTPIGGVLLILGFILIGKKSS